MHKNRKNRATELFLMLRKENATFSY